MVLVLLILPCAPSVVIYPNCCLLPHIPTSKISGRLGNMYNGDNTLHLHTMYSSLADRQPNRLGESAAGAIVSAQGSLYEYVHHFEPPLCRESDHGSSKNESPILIQKDFFQPWGWLITTD